MRDLENEPKMHPKFIEMYGPTGFENSPTAELLFKLGLHSQYKKQLYESLPINILHRFGRPTVEVQFIRI